MAFAFAVVTVGAGGAAAAGTGPAPVSVAVSGPATALQGSQITLTATVTGDSVHGAPQGTVTFSLDGNQISPNVSLVTQGTASSSQATLQYTIPNSLVSGPHVVRATYEPPAATWQSGGTTVYATTTGPSFSMQIGASGPPATTVQVQSIPAQIVPGQSATITATVTSADGSPVTGLVTFDDNGSPLGSATLTGGSATLYGVTGFVAGDNVITASYVGNAQPSSGTLAFSLPKVSTKLDTTTTVRILPHPVIHPGDTVTAVATVVQSGDGKAAPPGALVTFYVNGQIVQPRAQVPLGDDGTASLEISSFHEDVNVVTASYVGGETDNGSNGDAQVSVVPESAPLSVDTKLVYTGETTVTYGDTLHLSAHLTDVNGAGLPNEPIVLSAGSQSCSAKTNDTGDAACSFTVAQDSGTYDIGASFATDGVYLASNSPVAHLSVKPRATSLTYGGATSVDYGDSATLSATLLADGGAALAGRSITFTLGTTPAAQSCTGTTDGNGLASCTIDKVDQKPDSYTLAVSYAGERNYQSSSASPGFTVTQEATVAHVSVGGNIASGPVMLVGTVFGDGTVPVSGVSVLLSLGAASCSAVTGADGVASCPVTVRDLGPTTAAIVFSGNVDYIQSADSRSALVYSWLPGGGSFVIGDGSGSGSVPFWGAQWAKLNRVSRGGAPNAFTGFAARGATSCGATWATDPGNSARPPAGPLPTYMAVLVTDSVTKSGSTISGSTVHIVIVKTNAGYANDPGHAGTGTVVATIC